VNAGRVLLGLRESDTGATDEAMLDGPAPVAFSVREGWRAVTLDIGGALPPTIRLEKKNAGFGDSQFCNYAKALLKGDFAVSTEYGIPVTRVLRAGVGPSLGLTVPILAGGTLVGVMLGLLCAAWRGGGADRAVLVLSTLLMSVNYVVWVLAGQFLLAFKLRLFPIWGFESAAYLALPILIGIVSGLGRDIRFFRAAILDEVYKPYVRTAQAKGVGGCRIMFRHVLRNSLIPIVTYVSLSIPFLFTGSLMLESFFGIPGLGNVSLNAVHSSDMAVVRAVVILGALLYQVVNLLTDLCYAWLDPRVRLN
jgi:peptide/nickel transport system permease protein